MELNENILSEIKETLLPFGVEKIILFGSYANGKAGQESDIDLLVIKRTKKSEVRKERLALKKALYSRLSSYNLSFDLLVDDEKRIKERIDMGDLFYKEIYYKGKVIYA